MLGFANQVERKIPGTPPDKRKCDPRGVAPDLDPRSNVRDFASLGRCRRFNNEQHQANELHSSDIDGYLCCLRHLALWWICRSSEFVLVMGLAARGSY
jgi:hypothetical protein